MLGARPTNIVHRNFLVVHSPKSTSKRTGDRRTRWCTPSRFRLFVLFGLCVFFVTIHRYSYITPYIYSIFHRLTLKKRMAAPVITEASIRGSSFIYIEDTNKFST